jgi:hypothetical protein
MRRSCVTRLLFSQIVLASFASVALAAPCVAPPVSPESIAEFKANPQALVAPNSDTRAIEARVRELAGTSASLASDLVNLAQAEGTTARFRTAIAAGLAQAAVACSTVDQGAALQIQQAVAGFENSQFQASFAAVAGDMSTAATAAAASTATGNAGSVIIVNPNRGAARTFNPGGGGRSAVVQITSAPIIITSDTPDAGTTTAADPVSPTR